MSTLLTPPDKACIALTGVQPGFSAECRVLAGTATKPPAEKLKQLAKLLNSLKMMHPTSSPATMACQKGSRSADGVTSSDIMILLDTCCQSAEMQ